MSYFQESYKTIVRRIYATDIHLVILVCNKDIDLQGAEIFWFCHYVRLSVYLLQEN